jgi:hypothetical protein
MEENQVISIDERDLLGRGITEISYRTTLEDSLGTHLAEAGADLRTIEGANSSQTLNEGVRGELQRLRFTWS